MAITKATASSIAPAAKGSIVVGSATNDAGVLAVGTNTHILVADSTETLGMKWAAPAGGSFTTGNDTVTTGQTTSSSSFTDLTTVGPTVTLTTGTKALIMLTVQLDNQANNRQGTAAIEISGASSVSPSDGPAFHIFSSSNTAVQATTTYIATGLTAGSNTFKVKYKAGGSTTVNFGERRLSVIDLGS